MSMIVTTNYGWFYLMYVNNLPLLMDGFADSKRVRLLGEQLAAFQLEWTPGVKTTKATTVTRLLSYV